MIISRDLFVSTKEEDEVISSIILNECGIQPETCSKESCVLENIMSLPYEGKSYSLLFNGRKKINFFRKFF